MPATCRREWPPARCATTGEPRQLSLVGDSPPETGEGRSRGRAGAGTAAGRAERVRGSEGIGRVSLAAVLRAVGTETPCFFCGSPLEEVWQAGVGTGPSSEQQQRRVLHCRECGAELICLVGGEAPKAAGGRG